MGSLPSITNPIVGRLFKQLRARYPGIQLRVLEGSSGQVNEWLADARVDIAILYRYGRQAPSQEQTLATVDSCLIGTPGDPASPYRFRGTVLGDWLRFNDVRSRLVSVSRKDRSAILPLGRAKGEAYWYAPKSGFFTTSRYYADTLPDWIQRFNARRLPQAQFGTTWDLLLPPSAYSEADSVVAESKGKDFTFPHRVPTDPAVANEGLKDFPVMDQILAALPTRTMTIDRSDELKATIAGRSRYTVDAAALRDWVDEVQLGIGALHTSLSSTFFTPETTRTLHPSGRVVV